MTFIKNALVLGMGAVMAVSLSSTVWAKKCKDGETTEIAKFDVVKGKTLAAAINKSLTGKAGDPKNGFLNPGPASVMILFPVIMTIMIQAPFPSRGT